MACVHQAAIQAGSARRQRTRGMVRWPLLHAVVCMMRVISAHVQRVCHCARMPPAFFVFARGPTSNADDAAHTHAANPTLGHMPHGMRRHVRTLLIGHGGPFVMPELAAALCRRRCVLHATGTPLRVAACLRPEPGMTALTALHHVPTHGGGGTLAMAMHACAGARKATQCTQHTARIADRARRFWFAGGV